jgi:hypothetical protein
VQTTSLVLANGIAVGAVAKPAAESSFGLIVDPRLKTQRREDVADRLLLRCGGSQREFLPDLAARRLDLA